MRLITYIRKAVMIVGMVAMWAASFVALAIGFTYWKRYGLWPAVIAWLATEIILRGNGFLFVWIGMWDEIEPDWLQVTATSTHARVLRWIGLVPLALLGFAVPWVVNAVAGYFTQPFFDIVGQWLTTFGCPFA